MKNLILLLLLTIACSLSAQEAIYVQTNILGNYAVVAGMPEQGINTSAEVHLLITEVPDQEFAFNVGLGAGYTSISRAYKEPYLTLLGGFSVSEYFSAGLLAQYTMQSEALGIGGWLDLSVPVAKHLSIVGRGQLNLTTTNVLTPNITVAAVGAGLKYTF